MTKKLILGIDTSTDNCSVALLNNQEVLSQRSKIAKSAHSEKLIEFIREILEESNYQVQDIDCIGVNVGPGSFTGLRIGLSIAKGLAFPNNIPVYPIKSMPAMIESNNSKRGFLYFIKSHKNMIFYHYFANQEENLLDIKIEYGDIKKVMQDNQNIEIVGNFDFQELFEKSNKVIFPDGKNVAKLVSKNYKELKNKSGYDIEPYYLTSFQTQKWPGSNKK